MPDTTIPYRIYRYHKLNGYELVEELNVRKTYDNKRFCKPMPTIGEVTCRRLLKKISPWNPVDKTEVKFENMLTGKSHIQELYKGGTVIIEKG